MRVLMISSDARALQEGSDTWKRIEEYRKCFDDLRVLVSGRRFLDFWRVYREARKILKHGEGWEITAQDPFEHGLIAAALAEEFELPLQLQIHTDFLSPYFRRESWKNRFRFWIAKAILPSADGIRVVSERIKHSLHDSRLTTHDSRIVILPIFTDIASIKKAEPDSDFARRHQGSRPLILMASRLTKEKNIGLAIEAMKDLVEKYASARLVIVGDGPEKQNLEFRIKNLGLENHVSLEPHTDDLPAYLKCADIFLLTSHYEGYGRVAVEAAAAGLPVVMTDVGVGLGQVVSVGDKDAIVASVLQLTEDSTRRAGLISRQNEFLKALPANKDIYNRQYCQSLAFPRRLLLVTQKINLDDSVLGVYHRWVDELAKKFDHIDVICLYRGRSSLPLNVAIYSLGKERLAHTDTHALARGLTRIKYIFRFFNLIWRLRGDYNRVLVHMNPEYMLMAGLIWRLGGKRPILWYNHPMGDLKARIAIVIADRVLHTSPFAFSARYKKATPMPVGVDSDQFKSRPAIHDSRFAILYLGRLSPIKYVEVLIDAALALNARGIDFKLSIVGDPSKESEVQYAADLKRRAEPLIQKGKIQFLKSVSNEEAPKLYGAHATYVNLTPTGSFDKTIIEAMLSENVVVASNKAVGDILPEALRFQERSSQDLARALEVALKLSDAERKKIGSNLRNYALGRHDLKTLVNRLAEVLE